MAVGAGQRDGPGLALTGRALTPSCIPHPHTCLHPHHYLPAPDDFLPDEFDPSAVELMRALATKAKPAGHIYPFAMFSYP